MTRSCTTCKTFLFFFTTWLGAESKHFSCEKGLEKTFLSFSELDLGQGLHKSSIKKTTEKGLLVSHVRLTFFFFSSMPKPKLAKRPKESFGKGCQLFQSKTKQINFAMFCLWKKKKKYFFFLAIIKNKQVSINNSGVSPFHQKGFRFFPQTSGHTKRSDEIPFNKEYCFYM